MSGNGGRAGSVSVGEGIGVLAETVIVAALLSVAAIFVLVSVLTYKQEEKSRTVIEMVEIAKHFILNMILTSGAEISIRASVNGLYPTSREGIVHHLCQTVFYGSFVTQPHVNCPTLLEAGHPHITLLIEFLKNGRQNLPDSFAAERKMATFHWNFLVFNRLSYSSVLEWTGPKGAP